MNFQMEKKMDEKTAAAVNEATTLLTSYGLDVVGALVTLIIGWMVAGWAGSKLRKSL